MTNTIAYFIIIFLYFLDTGVKETIDIAFFLDCNELYKNVMTPDQQLRYLENPVAVCEEVRDTARKIVLVWGGLSLDLVIDIPLYLYLVRRFTLPFLGRKPMSLFVLLRSDNSVVFKRIPNGVELVDYNKNMYAVKTEAGLRDNFGNTWYIYKEGNNHPINDQNIYTDMVVKVFNYGYNKRNTKLRSPISFLPKLTKAHLIKYWNIRIDKNSVLVTPLPLSMKDVAKYYYYSKRFNIEVATNKTKEYEEDALGLTISGQLLESKQLVYQPVSNVRLRKEGHFSASVLYEAYTRASKLTNFGERLSGSLFTKSNKWLFLLVIVGAAIAVYYLFFEGSI